MAWLRPATPSGRSLSAAAAALVSLAAGISLLAYLRSVLHHHGPPPRKTIVAGARSRRAASRAAPDHLPYPPDAFPGAREVETEYGTIKVFEWGREEGEKVLLMHGIGTPCVALGDAATTFVQRGCRVMLFDFFGRGYSDAPVDIPYDERLYTTQILLVLASSSIPWTGSNAFHLLGYSLGGALAASFAAYHAHLLRSLTLICPGGLVRPERVSLKSRLLYSQGLLPGWLLAFLARRRLTPRRGASADVPEGEDAVVDFDDIPLSAEKPDVKVGHVVEWQLACNAGFVGAYMSTIRNAPIYGQHGKVWQRLALQLARHRRTVIDAAATSDFRCRRVCLILAERDPIIVKEEWIEDARDVLSSDSVEVHVVKGGHEVAISRGKEIADIAMSAWGR